MTPEELAHWRYRLAELRYELPRWEKAACRRSGVQSLDNDVAQALLTTRYLYEEAKYKVLLGEVLRDHG